MSDGLDTAIRRRSNGRLRQRGAVAVEFALVAPILIMLLMGIISTGLSYSHALGVTNAVREGARFGATADASAPSGTWTADVIARVHETQFDDPTSETSICVELWKNGGAVKSQCNSGGPGVAAADYARYPLPSVPAGVCVVRVVATRNFEIEAPPLLPPLGTKKLARGSVARYERDSC